jgi:hypothetical protein
MQTIKSFKLLIIALVVCNNLFSQTNVYKPFPQTYGSWIEYRQGPMGPGIPSISSWKKYEAFGDTTIGIFIYKKVTVANNSGYPTWNGTNYVISYGTSAFSFAYRNDITAKKVYYLDVTGGINKDTLWYDFNLNVGDTLKDTYSYFHYGHIINNQRRIVSSIDSVLICGTYYKQFNFGCTIGGGFETSLIEGVGFKDKFDVTGYLGGCPFEPSYVHSTGFSSCNINSVADLSSNQLIEIFPNPTFSELKIKASLQLTEYSIVNNVGVEILKGNLSDLQSINVSSIATGLYVIKIQNKSGNNYQSKFIKQ